MNISLLVLWGDSLTFTIARALAFNGHQVQVWISDKKRHEGAVWGAPKRIAAIPGVTIVADDTGNVVEHIDQLIVQGHPQLLRYRRMLDRLAPRARRLTAVSSGDRSRAYREALRLQWREWHWYGKWFSKVQRIAYKDGFYPVDLFGFLRPRRVVGFDTHSIFLQDQALFRAIHAEDWDSESPRPIRANFLGNRDPEPRGRILDSAEEFFTPIEFPVVTNDASKRMAWHVYTDAQPTGLGQEEFVRVLSESDFTLAPPGYSLVTHRPVEALLRGSIPVLNANELDLYDLSLKDDVNCIAVPPGGWPAAMKRIVNMNEAQIVTMRRHIQAMLANQVAYPALSRNICQRLGLNNRTEGHQT